MATQLDVYEGFWINWSHGSITGAQVTVKNGKSAYLIALMAILVQFSGGSLWTIIAYAIFNQMQSREAKAILRNSSGASSALEKFLHIAWMSYRSSRDRKRVPLAIACLAAIIAIGALVAGVLSSNVAATPSDVLLKPTSCGNWLGYGARNPYKASGHAKNSTLNVEYHTAEASISASLDRSRNHASICFNSTSLSCDPMGRRSNFVMEIRLSTTDLGINTPQKDRLNVNVQLKCTPLVTEGYSSFFDRSNLSILTNGSAYLQHQLHLPSLNDVGLTAFAYGNTKHWPYTFVHNNVTANPYAGAPSPGPRVGAVTFADIPAFAPENRSFTLIQPLRVLNATTHIFFFINEIVYAGPVDDPIFYAQNVSTYQSRPSRPKHKSETTNSTVWYAENPLAALGCAQYTRVCVGHSEAPRCTYLMSRGVEAAGSSMRSVSHSLGLTSRQESVLVKVLDALTTSDIGKVPMCLGESALLAKKYYAHNVFAALPPDQWIQEV